MTEEERTVFEFGPTGRSSRAGRDFWLAYVAIFAGIFGLYLLFAR